MRGSLFVSLVLAGGCASRIRTEHVGTGHGLVSTRAAVTEPSAAPGASGIALSRGTYDIDLRIGVPRAQLVDWKITCPGAEQEGTVGQAFDEYREKRLQQLTREREQQARIYARAVTAPPPSSTVVVGPPVATVNVRTPVGRGRVVVQPAPVVVREAPAEPAPSQPAELEVAPVTELPPGDLGQGVFPAHVRVVTQSDGACAITAIGDDPNVTAFYSVTRVRDLGVEAAERKQMIYVGATTARGRVHDRLIAYGADPQARQRRLEAEAAARAEAERKRGLELAAQREREMAIDLERRRTAELEAEKRRQRMAIEEAERRNREAIEQERRDAQLAIVEEQRQARLEAEAALQWERDQPARLRAEILIREKQVSIKWRLTLIAWLVGECHADPDRRGRIAREAAERERQLQARLELRLEMERIERERLIRIRMEQDRLERDRQREADRAASEEAARLKRIRDQEAHERHRQELARYQAEQAERENRRAIEQARREREARELAELELRRTSEAIKIRSTLTGTLIGFGARLRPAMPAPRIENPGPPPFEGAEWASGRWEWISLRGEWVWRGGGWRDSTRFGHAGGETVVVHRDPVPVTTVIVTPPPVVTPGVVIEVGAPAAVQPRPVYKPRDATYRPRPSRADKRRKDKDDKR